jgi:hypothetical protein
MATQGAWAQAAVLQGMDHGVQRMPNANRCEKAEQMLVFRWMLQPPSAARIKGMQAVPGDVLAYLHGRETKRLLQRWLREGCGTTSEAHS